MISCSEAVRQLWEYLDGDLPDNVRRKVDEHLGLCLRCCGEAEFAGELRKFLADHGDEEVLPEEVRRRLQSTLDGLLESR